MQFEQNNVPFPLTIRPPYNKEGERLRLFFTRVDIALKTFPLC